MVPLLLIHLHLLLLSGDHPLLLGRGLVSQQLLRSSAAPQGPGDLPTLDASL